MEPAKATLTGIARRPRPFASMEEIERCQVTAEEGIVGDYRGLHTEEGRKVTVLFANQWRQVCEALDHPLPWTARRANLFLEGTDNPRAVPSTISIGEVCLEVTGECDPCSRMDREHPGLRATLGADWRGGVCCRVVGTGALALGEEARIDTDDRARTSLREAGIREVIRFWFDESEPQQWFVRDPEFDKAIAARFRTWRDRAYTGDLDNWSDSPEGALALVLLLDQFSRNLFREDDRAFEADAKALEIAKDAIAAGHDARLSPEQRRFVYMPFMHAEDVAEQDRCVALMAEMDAGESTTYHANAHRDVIRKFGRFPHRNGMMGRETTPEEAKFLAEGGYTP